MPDDKRIRRRRRLKAIFNPLPYASVSGPDSFARFGIVALVLMTLGAGVGTLIEIFVPGRDLTVAGFVIGAGVSIAYLVACLITMAWLWGRRLSSRRRVDGSRHDSM